MATIEDLYLDQKKFMSSIMEKRGLNLETLSEEERIFWTKETILSIIKELTEVMDNLDWKLHRKKTDGSLILENLQEELIDNQKFLWNLMIIWKMSPEVVVEEYLKKSFVVEERWRCESSKLKPQILIVDLDGVLCEYPGSFTNWVKKHHPEIKRLSKADYPIEWENLKDEYRSTGGKLEAIPIKKSIQALKMFKEAGWSIVILTHRPVNRYKRIEYDTLKWLKDVGATFDKIVWAAHEKTFYLKDGILKGEVFIDDSPEICQAMSHVVKRTYCTTNIQHPEITIVDDLMGVALKELKYSEKGS